MNEDDGGREVEKTDTDFSAGHTSFLGDFYLILANDKNPTVKRNFKCSLRAALCILTVKAGAGLNSGSQHNADRKSPTGRLNRFFSGSTSLSVSDTAG